MWSNKQVIRWSIIIGILSCVLLLLPALNVSINTEIEMNYPNNLFIDVLIGIFSSCILTIIITKINQRQERYNLDFRIYTSAVELSNILYSLEQRSKLLLATSQGKPSYKDISFLGDIFALSERVQSLDICLKEQGLLQLSEKRDKRLIGFYKNNFSIIISETFTFAENLQSSYTGILNKIYGPPINDNEVKDIINDFYTQFLNSNKEFWENILPYRKELNLLINNAEEYGLKFNQASF